MLIGDAEVKNLFRNDMPGRREVERGEKMRGMRGRVK